MTAPHQGWDSLGDRSRRLPLQVPQDRDRRGAPAPRGTVPRADPPARSAPRARPQHPRRAAGLQRAPHDPGPGHRRRQHYDRLDGRAARPDGGRARPASTRRSTPSPLAEADAAGALRIPDWPDAAMSSSASRRPMLPAALHAWMHRVLAACERAAAPTTTDHRLLRRPRLEHGLRPRARRAQRRLRFRRRRHRPAPPGLLLRPTSIVARPEPSAPSCTTRR